MSNSKTRPDETRLAGLIEAGIAKAATRNTVINMATARRIAAAVHRGIDGELAKFAGSGELKRHQVARLELFYATKDEPQLACWKQALLGYITADQQGEAKQ